MSRNEPALNISSIPSGEPDRPLRVLCIGGTGQNGATLLTRMLGRIPGLVPVGELGYLWDWGLVENRACGCGLRFSDCPFWTKVGQQAFGGWDRIDPKTVLSLRRTVTSMEGRLPHPLAVGLILMPYLSPSYRRALHRYAEVTFRLYRAISEVSGGGIVVDSMKRPSHVFMVSRHPGLQVGVVHLVRDSRGVAYSNLKWVKRQSSMRRPGQTKGPYRVRRPPAKAGGRWLWINLAFELLGRVGVPVARLRYEDLVRNPRRELHRIAGELGIPLSPDDLAFIHGTRVDLPQDHLVAGNRMRLEAGSVALRPDEEWRTKMDSGQVRTVSLVTWPLLRRYDYTKKTFPPPTV
jgi:hypothetical protein